MRDFVAKICNIFFHGVELFCRLILAVEVVLIGYVVFNRYVLNITPRWGDELARVMLIWFGLISASLAVRADSHVRITLIDKVLKPKGKQILYIINQIIILLFSIFMIVYGLKLSVITSKAILPGMEISRSWLYLSLPFAGLTYLMGIVEHMTRREKKHGI